MATFQEKLAGSLRELQKLQNEHGFVVIRPSDLSRTHLQRLQFAERTNILFSRITSPYTIRLKLMWDEMRKVIVSNFPATKNRQTLPAIGRIRYVSEALYIHRPIRMT